MAQLATIQSFASPEDALEWVNLLKQHGIPYQWEEDVPSFDPSFAFNQASIHYNYLLRVPRTHLQKAKEVVASIAEDRVESYGEGHYLYSFELEELYEVLERPDEWSAEDQVLARKILAERGRVLNDDEVKALYENRLKEIRRPKTMDRNWIIGAYIAAALGVMGFVFGLGAIMLAWSTQFSKTDPTGQKYHAYDEATRRHGQRIMLVAFISMLGGGFALWLYGQI